MTSGCLCTALQSLTTASNRRRSDVYMSTETPVHIRQTRMPRPAPEFPTD
jgi:hypothetical protein